MNLDEQMPTRWFYIYEGEKTTFNWFLYEYACKLHESVAASKRKALKQWKSRRSDENVAEFCAYFSKRMRQSVYDVQDGKTEGAVFLDRYVSDYSHDATLPEIDAIMEVACKAWKELLISCSRCPTGCLADPDDYCEMFDRIERGERLSNQGYDR